MGCNGCAERGGHGRQCCRWTVRSISKLKYVPSFIFRLHSLRCLRTCSISQVFRRLARPAGAKEGGGHSSARDNALVFLRGHLGPAPSSWDRDRRKAFRKRVKGACRLIEAIVTADELG